MTTKAKTKPLAVCDRILLYYQENPSSTPEECFKAIGLSGCTSHWEEVKRLVQAQKLPPSWWPKTRGPKTEPVADRILRVLRESGRKMGRTELFAQVRGNEHHFRIGLSCLVRAQKVGSADGLYWSLEK